MQRLTTVPIRSRVGFSAYVPKLARLKLSAARTLMFPMCFASLVHRFTGTTQTFQKRTLSMKVHNTPLPNYNSFNPLLGATMHQLDSLAPRFEIQGSQIEILDDPAIFYQMLQEEDQPSQVQGLFVIIIHRSISDRPYGLHIKGYVQES